MPEDDPESNYAVFRRLLVDTGIVPVENVQPIKYHPDIPQMKANYEQELRKHVPFEDGYPLFDEIVLGVGEDGHTASIFPDRLDLFETTAIVAATRHPVTGQGRVTLTGNTINNAYGATVLCTGEKKRRILDEVLRENKPRTTARSGSAPDCLMVKRSPETFQFVFGLLRFPSNAFKRRLFIV